MAIINCPECNKQISDSATTCPHCGLPNPLADQTPRNPPSPLADQPPRNVNFLLFIGIFLLPMIFSWFTLRKGYTTTARVVSFLWLAVMFFNIVSSNSNYSESTQSESSISASSSPHNNLHGSTTATDIAQAYKENTVAADQRFKGKRFSITGIVDDINTDFMGDPNVTLKGGVNRFMEPHFKFKKSSSSELALIYKGDSVTLICTGRGDVAKAPIWDSCTLESWKHN